MRHHWPFTGRGDELDLIGDVLQGKTSAGILISGAAGVGKSRLLAEALTAATTAGWQVRRVCGTATGRAVPLGAFSRWAGRVRGSATQKVERVIAAVAGQGDAPILLGVDDAHLLDDLSALVVHQLLLREQAAVVISVRTGELAPDAITSPWKDALLRHVRLEPLFRRDCDDLLTAALGGDVAEECAQRLWDRTCGNVSFLRHLVDEDRAIGELVECRGQWQYVGEPTLAPSVRDLILVQIGGLVAAALAVLRAPAPQAPGSPSPLLMALAAFVRRETEQNVPTESPVVRLYANVQQVIAQLLTAPIVNHVIAVPWINRVVNDALVWVRDVAHKYVLGSTPTSAPTIHVTGVVPVGGNPGGVVATPDGNRFYVVSNDGVREFNIDRAVISGPIPIGPLPPVPGSLVISPNGTHVYATNFLAHTVSVIDADPGSARYNTVIDTIQLDSDAVVSDVAISPDGSRLYVPGGSNAGGVVLAVVDTTTNRVIATIPLPGENDTLPTAIAFSPDGKRAYVSNESGPDAIVIDTTAHRVVGTMPTGHGSSDIVVSPDGKRAYVSTNDTGVSVIDLATNTVLTAITVGMPAKDLAVSPDGRWVYVTAGGTASTIAVIDTATNRVSTTFPLAGNDVAVAPDGKRIYVSANLPSGGFVMVLTVDPPTTSG